MSEVSNIQRAAALVEQGAVALRSGDKARAFTLLREAIKLNPNNEHAWLWLAGAVPSDDQRRECLKRVLALNPSNTSAQRGLAALLAPTSSSATPPPAAPVAQPPASAHVFDPLMPSASGVALPTAEPPFDPLAQARPHTKPTSEPTFDPLVQAAPPIQRAADHAALSSLPKLEIEAEKRPSKSDDTPQQNATPVRRLSGNLAPEMPSSDPIPDTLRPAPKKASSSRFALLGLILTMIVLGMLTIVYIMSQQNRQQPVNLQPSSVPATSPPQPSATPTSLPTPTITAAELLTQAQGLVDAGDYKAAIEQYTAALAITKNVETYFARAQAYYAINDYAKAAQDYSSVIELDSKNMPAYHERGRSRFRTGDNEGAIADFTEALKLKPDDEPSYLRRGIVYRSIGKNEEAEADFSESIRIAPEKLDAYYHRGMTRLALQKYTLALADLNQALQINPDHVLSYAGRGSVQLALKDYGAALKDCSAAIERNATLIEPLLCRGQAYAGLKEYQQALTDFDAIISLYPQEAPAYRERARVKLAMKNVDAARADFEQAATIFQQQGNTAEYEAVQKELAAIK